MSRRSSGDAERPELVTEVEGPQSAPNMKVKQSKDMRAAALKSGESTFGSGAAKVQNECCRVSRGLVFPEYLSLRTTVPNFL